MSWPDVFPVFSEDQIDEYYDDSTPAEKAELEAWYGVAKILNPQPYSQEVVSVSLFWKNVHSGSEQYPAPTREILQNAVELGYADRFNPWDHYVLPLLEVTPQILKQNPSLAVRVHLAADLEFLAPDLIEAGNEVYLMKSSSINHAPGSLWRFLPLTDERKLITVTDIDRLNEIQNDLARTRMMAQTDVGSWRVPVPNDLTHEFKVCYLPLIAGQFGVKGGLLDTADLLKAFTWQNLRGKIEHSVIMPNCGPLPIVLHTWPEYGFDEFFLTVAAYPRLAQDGMMTFVPGNGSSQLMLLDIEYATWGNPASEVIYFPSGSCCGGEDPTRSSSPNTTEPAQEICENPKVAFLIPSDTEMDHAKIWGDYLREAGDSAGIFQASSGSESEGELALIRSHLGLLRDAVESMEWTHFILLPNDAVPTRSFQQLRKNFRLDPRSRMTLLSWEDVRKTELLRAQHVENLNQIHKKHAHFHSPWISLSREDALVLLSKDLTSNFENCPIPNECFYATALSALGRPPLQSVANRSLTWTPPSSDSRAAKSINTAIIAQISESGSFFATGIPPEFEMGDFELHLPS